MTHDEPTSAQLGPRDSLPAGTRGGTDHHAPLLVKLRQNLPSLADAQLSARDPKPTSVTRVKNETTDDE